MFQDRVESGRRLAERLRGYAGEDIVLIAIPRGGVVVAAEVSKALKAPLDIIIPRKIGAPQNEELAIGAVAGPNEVIINWPLVSSLNISDEYIKTATERELREIERRRKLYLGDSPELKITGKTAVIIDDGLATGSTARAAIKAAKAKNPRKVILAVPVAPQETVDQLTREVDELICLLVPPYFYAVGQFYQQFEQVTDIQVVDILSQFKKTA